MQPIVPFDLRSWTDAVPAGVQAEAVRALEDGRVLHFTHLPFAVSDAERAFLTPSTVGTSKNVSYDPADGSVGGAAVCETKLADLRGLMDRFAHHTRELVATLLPSYAGGVKQARTSLRPVEVAGRVASWRKDDTRLHVDSFPSAPTKGTRILRVFSNVNPDGAPRVWRVGEPFPAVARRFWPTLKAPLPGSRHLLAAVRATKSVRTRYDHYMLRLHDAMKMDPGYQASADGATVPFPAGTTWCCFTDQVSHAALSGQHQLEQTFLVNVNVLRDPAAAPLRVLEGLAGRKLA